MCVILLESLSRSFCCAVFNVAARILDAAMAIPTVMARLVSLLHRIVAWLIGHRVCTASKCISVVLLESLSWSFCSAVFNVAARILVATMVILTVISLVSRIVAWMITHRYV